MNRKDERETLEPVFRWIMNLNGFNFVGNYQNLILFLSDTGYN